MEWVMRGKAYRLGDNVLGDQILAVKHAMDLKLLSNPPELAKHVMEEIDPHFFEKIKKGDFIVAGKAFGIGHPHWQLNFALKQIGIAAVIAESFSRMFFRHSIVVGLPTLQCKDITKKVKQADELEVDLKNWQIKNLNTGEICQVDPLPKFMTDILEADGLTNFLKKKLSQGAISK